MRQGRYWNLNPAVTVPLATLNPAVTVPLFPLEKFLASRELRGERAWHLPSVLQVSTLGPSVKATLHVPLCSVIGAWDGAESLDTGSLESAPSVP